MKPISFENEGRLAPKILQKTLPKIIQNFNEFFIDLDLHFGTILDAKTSSKSYKKWHRFWKGFGSQNAFKMSSKTNPNVLMQLSQSHSKTL